jgi:pimeloyl-ACP methyl ester carboxylesterase
MLAHVADNAAVVRALGATTATVIGHDWGSPIAAMSALVRPDIFRGRRLLSVPYAPCGPVRPTDSFALAGGDGEFYCSHASPQVPPSAGTACAGAARIALR